MSDLTPRRPEPTDPVKAPGSERRALTEFLDFYRDVLARKAEGLSSADLARTTSSSNLTLGGLIKHMALVEDEWFDHRFMGSPEREPWASAPWEDDRDWELTTAAHDSPAWLLATFDESCERSRQIIEAAPSMDTMSVGDPGERGPWNLRWIMVHMIEEYARHVGHADLLREAIDGEVGD
jgi:uncharacterized damage-inducible protein DinB